VVLAAVVVLSPAAFAQFTNDYQTNTISGVVSNWDDDYIFAYPFDRLQVTNGGVLNNYLGYMGYLLSATNDSAVVSGSGSLWYNNGNLYVGYSGARSQLVITNGGVVYNSPSGYLGYNINSPSNTVLVTGTGSVWSNRSGLYVGYFGASNQLTVADNGSVVATNAYVGFNASSVTNKLTVSGGGLYVTNGSSNAVLDVRRGTLTLDSGTVTVDRLILTNGASSVITFSGGVLITKSTTVSNGVPFTVGNSTSAATLILLGGTHSFANGLDVLRGTLTLNSGTVTVDRLTLTNGASSVIAFSGGALITRSTTVSNGVPFTVGNGTNAATLNLLGGTHSFANGLVITNNAVLAGTGTINSNVTLAGILSPGSSPGTITNSGNLTVQPGAVLNFDLGTNSDLVVVNGNLTLDGTLNITNAGGFTNTTYTLFGYYGTLTTNGSSSILTIGATPNTNWNYTVDISSNGYVNLSVASGLPAGSFAAWQLAYFGSTNCATCGGNADYDGDGMSNTNEFLAGFNPTNSAAYLHIISIAKTNNDMNVTYLGANGDTTYSGGPTERTNVLEFTSGTANGSYTNNFVDAGVTNILSGGTGVGVVTNMVDSGGATNKPSWFYRVRLVP